MNGLNKSKLVPRKPKRIFCACNLSTKGFDGYCYMRFLGSLGNRHQFFSYSIGHATDGILFFKKIDPMIKVETRCDPSHYSIYEYLEWSKRQREYLEKSKPDM